jgi:hypothetical protein
MGGVNDVVLREIKSGGKGFIAHPGGDPNISGRKKQKARDFKPAPLP